MKPPKKLSGLDVVVGLGPTKIAVLVGVALLLLIAAAVVFFLWKRRKAAAAGPEVPQPPVAKIDTTLGDGLADSFSQFVSSLPSRARRSLDQFQPVLLLGTEASGKAELCERFSGVVQRRGELGAPAELVESNLRVHLGTDALVLELSEEVCRARMDTVEPGLRKVLSPLLRKRAPLIVVCIAPESLEKRSEQDLAELGAALRAKIDLFAELRGEPVEVRVALPEGAGASRLSALYALTQLEGVPDVLAFGSADEPDLRRTLISFGDLFSEALATHTADESMSLVSYLEAVPRLSQALSSVLGELFSAGPGSSAAPKPAGLYLVGQTAGPNPLEIPERLAKPQPHPLLKHRLIVVSALTLVVIWMSAGYVRSGDKWRLALEAVTNYSPSRAGEEHLRKQARAYAKGEARSAFIDSILPPYFSGGAPVVGCAFVDRIRDGTLRDHLADFICRSSTRVSANLENKCSGVTKKEPASPEELLYVMGLLYAADNNDLLSLIRQGREQFAHVDLSVPIIDDYLDLAGPNGDMSMLEELYSYSFNAHSSAGLEDLFRFIEPLSKVKSGEPLPPSQVLLNSASNLRALLADKARFGHAAQVLDSQTFSQKPLSSYSSVLIRYRERLELLSELAEHQTDLEHLIDAVERNAAPAVLGELKTVPALVERLNVLLSDRRETSSLAFELSGKSYEIDLDSISRRLRDAKLREVIGTFTETAPHDELALLGFSPADTKAEIRLGARWPEGVLTLQNLPKPYTREGFDKVVRPHLVALDKLWPQLESVGPQRDQLERIMNGAVERYARDYEKAIDTLYSSFKVAPLSAVGLKRVLSELAGPASGVRAFLSDVVHHATLNVKDEGSLLEPLIDVEVKYAPLAKVIEVGKTGGPLIAYQDILRDAVLKLDPTQSAPTAFAGSFVPSLTPLARLAHSAITDPKGSPVAVVKGWTDGQHLDEELARPFLQPVLRLHEQASLELGRALAGFNHDLLRTLDLELLSRYPFNAQAAEEIDPEELDAWFNPKRGRIAREILASVGELVQPAGSYTGKAFVAGHLCSQDAGCAGGVTPLLSTLNGLAQVTSLLFTEDGKTQPLRVRVVPHPFQTSPDSPSRPIALRLVVGDGHVDYFNQKPKESILELDWTKRQTSVLSVDLATDEPVKSFEPPTVVVTGTPWSFFRLLQKGTRDGRTRTFTVPTGKQPVSISLTVRETATDAFSAGAGVLAADTKGR